MRILLPTAAALGSLFVVAFQLQLAPFFSHLFVDDRVLWPVVFYGIWVLVVGLTLVLLALRGSVRRQSLPVLAFCATAMLLTLIHPMDSIARNFLVAVTFMACAGVLAIASAPFALLRFSASATVLSAVICLLDILFRHGFTNTVGRAAGLSINANVAAAGLLLGAASSFWTLPPRWRSPFVLIVGTAIFATLSRSTLLAAVVIGSGVAADLLWTRIRSRGPRPRMRWIGSGALALALAGWIALALFANDRFSVAATSSFSQIGSAPTALAEAREAIASSIRANTASRLEAVSRSPPASPSTAAPQPAPSTARTPPSAAELEKKTGSKEIIKEIARRAENEGDINSISARGLLMERAYLAYKGGPFFGQGLAAAHALQPHNTFLLFALAFGHLGWLVPLAFLGLTAYSIRSVQQLPVLLASFTVMMTSHDIFFMLGLLAPLILGIAGLNAQRHRVDDAPDAVAVIRYAAAAAPAAFFLGGISTLGIGASSIAGAPKLLLFLVFCAITLWSVCVWRWHQELFRHEHPVPRDLGWD